ncbi:histidine kinase [Vibrio coralliilyticus]|uniref:sensor histidine kinase n=1 Tax=Vibrio coralliilyticus TaxID=190893 RepID=UPI0008107F01|nr:HAMP domain-containing sensor histidine kinase [Vibrio coralliilyticus]ANW25515.1 histidine kinase [Vibrio coralliilyticus]
MKIRSSLRLYFLFALLVMGAITILIMSALAMSYFFSGMEMSTSGYMRSQAFQYKVEDGRPVQVNELTIATRWEDLPKGIQDNLDENELVTNRLLRKIEGIPIIETPKRGYFAMRLEHKGKIRYASLLLVQNEFSPGDIPHFKYIIYTALGAILLFSVVLVAIIRTVSIPVERLINWARTLNKDNLSYRAHAFEYSELNALAEIIRTSLISVQESLDREQQFLGYASHELRTPIAVTRTNTELLRKMILKEMEQDKQLEVLERIERAGYTMTDLTETLLWLNRRDDKRLSVVNLSLGSLVNQIDSELRYLCEGKDINVQIMTDDIQRLLPQGVCRIVLTNLIRNAFQHTYQGEVYITQSGCSVTITNRNVIFECDESDLGFGLGLELTEKLVKQCAWYYSNKPTEFGREVEVQFT